MEPVIYNPISGTTTNAYVTALDWDVTTVKDKLIRLKNSDAANSLKYQLLSRVNYDSGLEKTEVSETTLMPGEIADFSSGKALGRIKVQVKAAAAGSQATCQIDYGGKM
jgi:hypothetical protein